MNTHQNNLPAYVVTIAAPVPLHQTFDYLPAANTTQADYEVGRRVIIPFGNRRLIGVVIGTHIPDIAPTHKLKAILELFDRNTGLNETLVDLLKWAAQYYCHPLGEVFQTALPQSLRTTNTNQQTYTLIKWQRTPKAFEGRANATKQLAILDTLTKEPDGLWQENLRALGYTPAQLRKLEQAGYLTSIEQDPLTASCKSRKELRTLPLNEAQESVANAIAKHFSLFHVALLHGITGSGKTEVYIELVDQVVRSGKQALVLIPEINLTPQTFARFQSQLNHPIGILHSDMSAKEKYTTWQLAKQGIAKIIIGTRSAIFTPFEALGLIVIDEEQDHSFKQIDNFKYSARDLAVKRGQFENCPVVLGSATPCLETIQNAKTGKYSWHRLNARAGAGTQPAISLINVKTRPLSDGISLPLLAEIRKELDEGNQVILFQNRRGFSPTLMCYDCGTVVNCKHCDARMTVHSQPPHLHCHHCDYKRGIPLHCEHCDSSQLNPIGTGTERIEQGLHEQLPNIEIVRMDRDAIRNQRQMEVVIDQINQGKPCVIIGTQMLAKGHDFHHVTLVAVVDADALFFSANFRALETGTQQLLQVAGRTGRGAKKGRVLIQTRQSEHYIFDAIIDHNYDEFCSAELEDREACQLPPFSKMICIRAESKDLDKTLETLNSLRAFLEQNLQSNVTDAQQAVALQIAGPIQATIAKKSGIYRSYLHLFLLRNDARKKAMAYIHGYLQQYKNHHVRLTVDVDPQDYL